MFYHGTLFLNAVLHKVYLNDNICATMRHAMSHSAPIWWVFMPYSRLDAEKLNIYVYKCRETYIDKKCTTSYKKYL